MVAVDWVITSVDFDNVVKQEHLNHTPHINGLVRMLSQYQRIHG